MNMIATAAATPPTAAVKQWQQPVAAVAVAVMAAAVAATATAATALKDKSRGGVT
jgi:hypothetical protein